LQVGPRVNHADELLSLLLLLLLLRNKKKIPESKKDHSQPDKKPTIFRIFKELILKID